MVAAEIISTGRSLVKEASWTAESLERFRAYGKSRSLLKKVARLGMVDFIADVREHLRHAYLSGLVIRLHLTYARHPR